RPRDVYDNASPSGNSVAVDVLLKLSVLLDREDYRQRAETVLENLSGVVSQIPGGFGRLLSALDFYLSTPYEVAIVGDLDAPDTKALLNAVYSAYLPNKVVAGRSEEDEEAAGFVPLLTQRPTRDGKSTAYVCVQYACQSPATDPEELRRQLGVG
ncbi:MAG: thioredoxin domain-containing protein, partial [Actinomycetota bacterium]|nr:thioredoxin domain-containing protein [Actinomycetota bacterium]